PMAVAELLEGLPIRARTACHQHRQTRPRSLRRTMQPCNCCPDERRQADERRLPRMRSPQGAPAGNAGRATVVKRGGACRECYEVAMPGPDPHPAVDAAPKLGRYRLLHRIGTGGMAEVFRAVSSGEGGFEKEVVIKRIWPELAQKSVVQMFLDEARL